MKPLRVDIITIFPDYFRAVFDYGIIRRARAAGLVTIEAHDLRAWTSDKHHVVDDRPFGGGDGMVMKPEPIFAAVKSLTGANRRETVPPGTRVVLLSPQGQTLTQASAAEFAKCEHVILICGRYEGVDERVADAVVTDEISIGDYVLSGGEPAMGSKSFAKPVCCPARWAVRHRRSPSLSRMVCWIIHTTRGLLSLKACGCRKSC